ncbi:MAG TPA: homoserine O-acetyltransferase [Caldithrix abyssi]|uniref:Homoserine O-acetyltransferase n=1 Tax=Caldithrix abyssi TaxID=187145 RepID=A0A7V4U0R9_CALAY|nr:homoserine O-acetyltransferase [Caldithrix abyssi]
MKTRTKILQICDETNPLNLECGQTLSPVNIAYETYGRLNSDGSNAILVCHALSGDAHAAGKGVYDREIIRRIPFYRAMRPGQPGWWDGMIGPGKAFDTDRYFVVCSNVIGSCYGSTGPASINPRTGKPWQADFPQITVRDMVRAQYLLLKKLGVHQLVTVSGGSLGGMQTLEWALMYPELVQSIIPVATSARHSAWAVGFNHLARHAVRNDPDWRNGFYRKQPAAGLALARQIGMISYRTDISFGHRFGRQRQKNGRHYFDGNNLFEVENYLNHQGRKLVSRFDANSFLILTRAIDLHDVGKDRGGYEQALQSIRTRALCIGIDSDILYPAREQQEIARFIPNSRYAEINSNNGHDAFLIEFEQMEKIIKPFLKQIG